MGSIHTENTLSVVEDTILAFTMYLIFLPYRHCTLSHVPFLIKSWAVLVFSPRLTVNH